MSSVFRRRVRGVFQSRAWKVLGLVLGLGFAEVRSDLAFAAPEPYRVEANRVGEIQLASAKDRSNPFLEVQLDAVVTESNGHTVRVPAFWAGERSWRFRYASPTTGAVTWRTECSDTTDAGLHGIEGRIEVTPYRGDGAMGSGPYK